MSEYHTSFDGRRPMRGYNERCNIYQGPNELDEIFGFDEFHQESYDKRLDREFLEDNVPAIDP